MKPRLTLILLIGLVLQFPIAKAQVVKLTEDVLIPNQVSVSYKKIDGKSAVRIVKDTAVKAVDEPTFVRIRGIEFSNGTIEVKVFSRLLKDAPAFARGFIGVAFRIDELNSKYESIYIRPTNGRAEDQVRRNHSIQYYSYPDYKFDRLRKENPEQYESYSDMALNEWINMKITVNGQEARLYLNDATQPSLVVKDMKHGAAVAGGIGLWVEVGTEGYFADLKVTKD